MWCVGGTRGGGRKQKPFFFSCLTPLHSTQSKHTQGGKVMAEYVWIGGTGADLRSKCRTLTKLPKSPADLPVWNYDGSSTGQAPGDDSEVFIVPRAIYKDPFRKGDNILVMCDAYEPPDPKAAPGAPLKPIPTNTRFSAAAAMEKVCGKEEWCVVRRVAWEKREPEHTHTRIAPPQPHTPSTGRRRGALVWHRAGVHSAQHPHQVAAGVARLRVPGPPGPLLLLCRRGRRHRPRHHRGPLQSLPLRRHQHLGRERRGHARAVGVPGEREVGRGGRVCGVFVLKNACFNSPHPPLPHPPHQVGPCVGIEMGDQLWMSRYILLRVCEVRKRERGVERESFFLSFVFIL